MAGGILADVEASGIYQIRNLVNGKRYIGSAVCIRKRWAEHRSDLRSGRHHSVALQRAWIRYGENSFEFLVVENCRKHELIRREQVHIDARSEYNICKKAGSSLGVKHSAETRAKMSARLVGNQRTKGRKYSREICERMAAPKRGRKRPPRPKEWCRKISEAKKGHSVGLGREVPAETRERIRESLTGRKKPLSLRASDPRLTLTDPEVEKILEMRVSGAGFLEISNRVGVTRQLAQKICARERYEWVRPDLEIPTFKRKGWTVEGRRRGVIRGGNGTCNTRIRRLRGEGGQ